MPPVNQLYGEFRGQGLEVLLVTFREDPGRVRQTAQERGYVAPVLLDETGDVAGRLYGVWGPPSVYVIDRDGRLVGRAVGPRPWGSPATRRFLRALLEEKPQP